MGLVLHAGGWRVEETVGDFDDTGRRTWFEAVAPEGGVHFVTVGQLQQLLHQARPRHRRPANGAAGPAQRVRRRLRMIKA
ncbi:hypothetical protein ACPPVO_22700 [Dactylosporangium sp. McL0621]|uniref:hypothetical protein n=1 Tax=Dactylosporangium sp. McL0621 TaxID=3415678 RepID=UPI003CF84E13